MQEGLKCEFWVKEKEFFKSVGNNNNFIRNFVFSDGSSKDYNRELVKMLSAAFSVEKIKKEDVPEKKKKGMNEEFNEFFLFSDGSVIGYFIYHLSVNVLDVAYEVLRQNLEDEKICYYDNENQLIKISVSGKNSQILVNAVKEAADLRSSNQVNDLGNVNIIRNLSWKCAIQESNRIAIRGICHAIYISSGGEYNIKVFTLNN